MSTTTNTTLRRAGDRGHFDHGWLDTYHSFSFAGYQDPAHMGFRSLRVINEDFIAAGRGFGPHPHRDMEILTWVLAGELEHGDNMGNGSIIRPGDAQRMTAGRGVIHSESNPSAERTHMLQIWIEPDRGGLDPGYEQKHFADTELRDRLRVIASPDGREDSITFNQDALVMVGRLGPDVSVSHELARDRGAWLQVARGGVTVDDVELAAGDGLSIEGPETIEIMARVDSEVILFDLA